MSRSIQVDTKTFLRFWGVILGLAVVVFLVMQALPALIIIFLALFLAVALTPLARKINRSGSKNGLAAGVTVGGIVLAIALIVGLVTPIIISTTTNFIEAIPEQLQNSDNWLWLDELGEQFGISDTKEQIVEIAKNFAAEFLTNVSNAVFTSVSAIASFLTAAILTIVLTILFMTQGPALMRSGWRTLEKRNRSATLAARRVTERITGVISKYISGQVLVALLDGSATMIVVFLLALLCGFSAEYAIPMGLISLVFYLIPMFGPIISCVIISLVLAFQAPLAGLIFLVYYAVFAQIENNVISPKIQGNSLNLPSLVILIAVTIGMYMFGLLGAIISIPIAGIIKVLIEEYPNLKQLSD